MFNRLLVTNTRQFSHKIPPVKIPINLEMQSRINELESIIKNQSKTIDYLQNRCYETFEKGFAIGMITPITMICLIRLF